MSLPKSFLDRPIAHRALHDTTNGRPENSLAAIRAAIDANYGIEIDLQPSADRVAMVFHDQTLERLTAESGPVAARTASQLQDIPLVGAGEGIPTLTQVLELVAGRVPLLIEIKDKDGTLGPDIGLLEDATARALDGYTGDVAVMSFNPNSIVTMAELCPDIPRGLVTEDYTRSKGWKLSDADRERLSHTPHYGVSGSCFVSHNHHHLDHPHIDDLKAQGANILCWTIRSPEEEDIARKVADNVTFEGYMA